jgi:hypothetical protein
MQISGFSTSIIASNGSAKIIQCYEIGTLAVPRQTKRQRQHVYPLENMIDRLEGDTMALHFTRFVQSTIRLLPIKEVRGLKFFFQFFKAAVLKAEMDLGVKFN